MGNEISKEQRKVHKMQVNLYLSLLNHEERRRYTQKMMRYLLGILLEVEETTSENHVCMRVY
jgi:hypothetical protein